MGSERLLPSYFRKTISFKKTASTTTPPTKSLLSREVSFRVVESVGKFSLKNCPSLAKPRKKGICREI